MLSYVDAPYEHLCKCEHLTKSSSCGGMCRSPHASPPPRAREFSGGVISHHLTDFGAVPVLRSDLVYPWKFFCDCTRFSDLVYPWKFFCRPIPARGLLNPNSRFHPAEWGWGQIAAHLTSGPQRPRPRDGQRRWLERKKPVRHR